MMSEGIRSAVNWTRRNCRLRTWPSVRMRYVLPIPGTPSSSTLPWAKSAISVSSITPRSSTMTFSTSEQISSNCRAKAATASGPVISEAWAVASIGKLLLWESG